MRSSFVNLKKSSFYLIQYSAISMCSIIIGFGGSFTAITKVVVVRVKTSVYQAICLQLYSFLLNKIYLKTQTSLATFNGIFKMNCFIFLKILTLRELQISCKVLASQTS